MDSGHVCAVGKEKKERLLKGGLSWLGTLEQQVSGTDCGGSESWKRDSTKLV